MSYDLSVKLSETSLHRRRAAISSVIGTTIEWYDFFIYGTVGALVFPTLFFPESDPYAGLMQTFLIFAIGFVARPVGSFFFSHFGDRFGRKTTLIFTLLMMGIATTTMGLLPTYETIGIWAPLLLSILRFLQGLSAGGEWGGAVLLSMEWAGRDRRGFFASLPQLGSPFGLVLSSTVVSLLLTVSGDAFFSWAWRIPFLFSLGLVIVGLYARLRVLESPEFQKVLKDENVSQAPVLESLRTYPKTILWAILVNIVMFAAFYTFSTFFIGYGSTYLNLDQNLLTNATVLGGIAAALAVIVFGYFSDLVGARNVYAVGVLSLMIWAYPYFALVNSKQPFFIVIAVAFAFFTFGAMYGPLASFVASSFPARLRYSGSSVAYAIGAVLGGGIAPMISTFLVDNFDSAFAVSTYLISLALLGLIGALKLKEL